MLEFSVQARIDDLGVNDDEMAIVVVEGVEIGPEVFLPKTKVILANRCRWRPIIGFVTDVMITGHQIEIVPEISHLFVEAGRGLFIETGDRRDRMDEIAKVDDESEIP